MASKRSPGRRSQPQEIILKVSCGVCGVEVPDKHPLCEKCREIPEYRDELNRRIAKAQEILFSSYRRQESEKLDVSTRPITWRYQADENRWEHEAYWGHASIRISILSIAWCPWIHSYDGESQQGPICGELTEAMDWAEEQIAVLEKSIPPPAEEEEDEEDIEPTVPPAHIAEFWASVPATYRVVIDLDYRSLGPELLTLSTGKTLRVGDRFPSPETVLKELQLPPSEVTIEQLIGEHHSWFRITSRVTYYQEAAAFVQAQQLWERTTILDRHRAGAVRRARYGVAEVETNYCVWIGGCEDPQDRWPRPQDRSEHLAFLARRDTLLTTMNVDGFRRFLHVKRSDRLFNETRILRMMHEARLESLSMSSEARAESEAWLSANPSSQPEPRTRPKRR